MNLRDLRQYLKALRRRAIVIVLLAVVFSGFTAYQSLKTPPVYTASALVLISPSAGYLGADAITNKLVKTYTQLMTKRPLLEQALADLKLDEIDPLSLANKITVVTVPGTLFMNVSVTDTSPSTAAAVANRVTELVVQPDRVPWNEATKVYLKLFLQTNNLVLVEPAEEPAAPVGTGRTKNVLLAGGVGILLGVGFAFLMEALDTGLKKPEDVEAQVELPVLARIPSRPVTPSMVANNAEALPEAARTALADYARRILLRSQDRTVRSILLTSPRPGEGKSNAAAYLAIGFAAAGNRTVLVDGSIENPTQHRLFGLENDAGLMDALMGSGTPASLLKESGVENLRILTVGPMPSNPSGLLVESHVRELLDTLYQDSDIVVIDTASLTTGAEVAPLARSCDRGMLVIRANSTSKELAQRGRDVLEEPRGRHFRGSFHKF